MLRGHRSIYLSLFETDQPTGDDNPVAKRKGRDANLHQKKVELLIHRYYYYTRIVKKTYKDTLEILENDELFIAERTIINTIQAHVHRLQQINNEKPDLNFFRTKYPALKW